MLSEDLLYTLGSTIYFFVRFFTVPIMVLIATFAVPKYMRAKVVTILELFIDAVAYLIFMVRLHYFETIMPFRYLIVLCVKYYFLLPKILTRPSAANRNFPYHVRTSQIGFVSHDGKVQTVVDFPHSVYGDRTDFNCNSNRFVNYPGALEMVNIYRQAQ